MFPNTQSTEATNCSNWSPSAKMEANQSRLPPSWNWKQEFGSTNTNPFIRTPNTPIEKLLQIGSTFTLRWLKAISQFYRADQLKPNRKTQQINQNYIWVGSNQLNVFCSSKLFSVMRKDYLRRVWEIFSFVTCDRQTRNNQTNAWQSFLVEIFIDKWYATSTYHDSNSEKNYTQMPSWKIIKVELWNFTKWVEHRFRYSRWSK